MKVSTCVLGLLLAIAPLQSFPHDPSDGTELLLTQLVVAQVKDLAQARGDCLLELAAWISAEAPTLEERIEAAANYVEQPNPSYPVSESSWQEITQTMTKCGEELEAAEKKANTAIAALRQERQRN